MSRSVNSTVKAYPRPEFELGAVVYRIADGEASWTG